MKYFCQAMALVEQTVFLNGIEQVWKPWTQPFLGMPTQLLMENFFSTKLVNVQMPLNLVATTGYTSQVQVLDVGVNKTFKGPLPSLDKKNSKCTMAFFGNYFFLMRFEISSRVRNMQCNVDSKYKIIPWGISCIWDVVLSPKFISLKFSHLFVH